MMRRVLLTITALMPLCSPAQAAPPSGETLQACLMAAAKIHNVPPFAMLVLLMVEGGKLGQRSPNTNGTGDLGPWQINEIWVQKVARYWGVGEAQAHRLLRDDLCSNADAAAWILGQTLSEAGGRLWDGVGRYHSMRPDLQQNYLNRAFEAATRIFRRSTRG